MKILGNIQDVHNCFNDIFVAILQRHSFLWNYVPFWQCNRLDVCSVSNSSSSVYLTLCLFLLDVAAIQTASESTRYNATSLCLAVAKLSSQASNNLLMPHLSSGTFDNLHCSQQHDIWDFCSLEVACKACNSHNTYDTS